MAKIVAHQVDAVDGKLYLKCRWRGFTSKLDSWQTADVLVEDCPDMVVEYIHEQKTRDQAIKDLIQQQFPDLDRQNAIQARKRKPGATVAGKRKGRGRVGRTLQQQRDGDDAEAVKNDARHDNDDVCEPSGKNNEGCGGSNENRPKKTYNKGRSDSNASKPNNKHAAPATGGTNEVARRQKNRERDERRRRWTSNRATTNANKTKQSDGENQSRPAKSKATTAELVEGEFLIARGDLLQADDDIIIHQTNCISKTAKGLAKDIFTRFPYADTYQTRTEPNKPDTISMHGQRGGKQRLVANLYAQHKPGSTRKGGNDNAHEREDWFWRCMLALGKYIKQQMRGPVTVGIPWRIGCGMAGGNWNRYKQMIEDWVRKVRTATGDIVRVTVYQQEITDGRKSDDNVSRRSNKDAAQSIRITEEDVKRHALYAATETKYDSDVTDPFTESKQQNAGEQRQYDDAPAVEQLLIEAKKASRRHTINDLVPIFSGTVKQVCEHRPHARYMSARRNQLKHGISTANARRLARKAGHVRIPGITYGDETEMVSDEGHTNAAMVGTHGGGDGPWVGIPSTPKQKRSQAYALHTRVQPSKIDDAGLGLFMLERAKAEERVAIYSGDLLTKEQADRSTSKYIVKVGKYYLDGRCTSHAVGRYVNYAPAKDANARLRAGTKPTWDPIRRRWWISIRAKRPIKPGEEIRMPYGQAYKGLPKKTVVKPMMRQVAAGPTNGKVMANATGWRRAYQRAMKRITTVAQRGAKAMADMKVAIDATISSLMSWRNDMDMASKTDSSDRASTGQCHPRVTGGSTPPAVNNEVDNKVSHNPKPNHNNGDITGEVASGRTMAADHIRWNDDHERPIQVEYESNRTHYGLRTGGKTPKSRSRHAETTGTTKGLSKDQAIARARAKATKRATRRERQSKEWKTLT